MPRVTHVVRRFTPVLLILALALIAGPALAHDGHDHGEDSADGYQPVPVGDAAPDFTLENLDGESHSLSDLAGEPAVLVFFRGAW